MLLTAIGFTCHTYVSSHHSLCCPLAGTGRKAGGAYISEPLELRGSDKVFPSTSLPFLIM